MDCFKSYDVRGVIGDSVTEAIFFRIGKALALVMSPKLVILGHDARETSSSLSLAVREALISEGADVIDIGLCGTEEVYFATPYFGAAAGVMVTASHNPIDYNGLKFVGPSARPLDINKEFREIERVAESISSSVGSGSRGSYSSRALESKESYARKILDFIDPKDLPPLKVVINCGNGAAGPALKEICNQLERLGSKLTVVPHLIEPDSSFPNGIPNPILEENHHYTRSRILSEEADFGVAFDGDFDRCFFFDELGEFVPGEIMVGLLTEFFAGQDSADKIVHDPRVVFGTRQVCKDLGITAIQSQTGHLFMKKVLRDEQAVYGGEMSAHHYFKDFHYCDSGMIPWLMIASLLGKSGQKLSEVRQERQDRFPSSGELNFLVQDPELVLTIMEERYGNKSVVTDRTDGLSFEFDLWRFNLRSSNTEPLIRLNVETKGDKELLSRVTAELVSLIETESKG